jgi:hypothetical protein
VVRTMTYGLLHPCRVLPMTTEVFRDTINDELRSSDSFPT